MDYKKMKKAAKWFKDGNRTITSARAKELKRDFKLFGAVRPVRRSALSESMQSRQVLRDSDIDASKFDMGDSVQRARYKALCLEVERHKLDLMRCVKARILDRLSVKRARALASVESGKVALLPEDTSKRYSFTDTCARCKAVHSFSSVNQIGDSGFMFIPIKSSTDYNLYRPNSEVVGRSDLVNASGDKALTAQAGLDLLIDDSKFYKGSKVIAIKCCGKKDLLYRVSHDVQHIGVDRPMVKRAGSPARSLIDYVHVDKSKDIARLTIIISFLPIMSHADKEWIRKASIDDLPVLRGQVLESSLSPDGKRVEFPILSDILNIVGSAYDLSK